LTDFSALLLEKISCHCQCQNVQSMFTMSWLHCKEFAYSRRTAKKQFNGRTSGSSHDRKAAEECQQETLYSTQHSTSLINVR